MGGRRGILPLDGGVADVWAYENPVRVVFGRGAFEDLPASIAGRPYVLVTYPDSYFADLGDRLAGAAGKPLAVVDDVAPNPDFKLLGDQVARLRRLHQAPQAFVALGGGSVIDTAKVLAAANGDFAAVTRFLETGIGRQALGAVPVIAVPTTAGTGSEATCWATVWDVEGDAKHSLALPGLFPEVALVDPMLMLGKPRELTVATGLDALSHALESLWNRNANPVSMTFAVSAAREAMEALPRLIEDLGNVVLRERMARAALFAGLAFSNTKTAIAHSLSYPITLRHNVPHGIACSFSLPMVMRSVETADGICAAGLEAVFGTPIRKGADRLERLLNDLGISTNHTAYGVTDDEWHALLADALKGERGQNFIGSHAALVAAARAGKGMQQPAGHALS